jgi:putative phage-type endonuclease
MQSREWHEARRRGIGGSDWVDVLGIPPYGCARELWYEKTGTEPDYDPEETGAMVRGQRLEPLIAKDVASIMGRTIRRPREPKRQEGLRPWHVGNPDRVIAADNSTGLKGPGILEIKSVNEQVARKVRYEGYPEGWVAQITHYMRLYGYEWGAMAVLEPLNWDLRLTFHLFDQGIWSSMEQRGDEFWAMVESGTPPDRLKPSSRQCKECSWRSTCQGAALYSGAPEDEDDGEIEDLTMDYDLSQLVRERTAIVEVRDDAVSALDDVNHRIKTHLGEPRKVACAGGRVYYYRTHPEKFDKRGLKQKYPEIYKELTHRGEQLNLRVYPA